MRRLIRHLTSRTRRAPGLASGLSLLLVPFPVVALERIAYPVPDQPADWGAGATTSLAYYNNCTGWVWVWSRWDPGDQIGTCFGTNDSEVSNGCGLLSALQLTFSPMPSGYGYTGTLDVLDACDCSGTIVSSQPYLPAVSGWNNVLPYPVLSLRNNSEYLLRITMAAPPGQKNDLKIATDHPARGPTGPTACGTCFPSTREVHTLQYGTLGTACPGIPLSDGVCDVELAWTLQIFCAVGTEALSWGRLKDLYR